eukprot:g1441.t1
MVRCSFGIVAFFASVLFAYGDSAKTEHQRPIVYEIPDVGSVKGQGSFDGNGSLRLAVFKGIPYAKSPVDSLRWQPPEDFGPWDNVRDASNFGSSCVQPDNTLNLTLSEDCLFLNIAAPAKGKVLLPTMVWIHGGAYNTGSSSIPLYDPVPLVENSELSVVVVTLNYRLNIFGFLGGGNIANRSVDGSSGNFGIQDQRFAMKWVKAHIIAFGGDPNKITIFGESAGGNSVFNHLAQPHSFEFYHRAVIESGVYDEGAMPLDEAEMTFVAAMHASGCKAFSCLETMSAPALLELGIGVILSERTNGKWGPVVDGVSLSDTPANLIRNGNYNSHVPVLIGSNRDEMAYWTSNSSSYRADLDEDEFDALAKSSWNLSDKEIQSLKLIYAPGTKQYAYPSYLGNYSEWWWAFTRVATDTVPGLGPCAVRMTAQQLLDSGTPEVYAYFFAHPTQSTLTRIPSEGPGSPTVAHASEIAYVFGNKNVLVAGEEADLASSISTLFSNFARFGNPNGANRTNITAARTASWPPYTHERDNVLRMDIPSEGGIREQKGLRKTACDWMDAHIPPPSFRSDI